MQNKAIVLALALTQASVLVSAAAQPSSGSSYLSTYWQNFPSAIDPTKINYPKIPQTTSYNVDTECKGYAAPDFVFDPKQWPTVWSTATSNGMDKTKEFTDLMAAIDWKSMPNIPVRKANKDGSLDMTGYDAAKDPDCWWSASGTTCSTERPNINSDIFTCAEPETWGLSYDDGPNCSHNAFYDFLQDQKLKASMFYSGSNTINWPLGALRGVLDGHHLADHTWSHQAMTTLTNEEVLAELYYTQKAIKLAAGVTPKYWRPAFGDIDDRVRWIATQLGLTAILWDYDTDDWAAGNVEPLSKVEDTYQKFIKMGTDGFFANRGNIVLTHEINNTTMSLALKYVPQVQKAFKHVVNIATCMNITNPYFENTVTFPTFDQYIAGVVPAAGAGTGVGVGVGVGTGTGAVTGTSAPATAVVPGTTVGSASASASASASLASAHTVTRSSAVPAINTAVHTSGSASASGSQSGQLSSQSSTTNSGAFTIGPNMAGVIALSFFAVLF
ncbi:hypothetical protein BDF14DRAFT_1804806 [Spinellus fusiger]|nr:hypothetical protein BDF14DRAFT_1804806 [Spinellus fusiger]